MTDPPERFDEDDYPPGGTDTESRTQWGGTDAILPITFSTIVPNPYAVPLEGLEEPVCIVEFIQEQRSRLNEIILEENHFGCETFTAIDIARRYSDLIDASVCRMFVLACAASGANPQTIQLTIVATGGYGRRELAPFSDIDITFIPQRDGDTQTDRVVKELFRLVMDIFIAKCGLEVGYAYRLFSDCTSLDHQTSSGLLDARYIAGSQRLFIMFEDAFWDGFNAPEFIFTKIDERNENLTKHGLFPRCIEPHIKEGPGGLRDIHTAVWLIQARGHLAATSVRGNRGLNHLSEEVGIDEAEVSSLKQAKELLFKVRNALHVTGGAERDQLVVTRQEEVAVVLGYTKIAELSSVHPAVERFMADLFPALAVCRRVADRVMRSVGNSKLLLGVGIDSVDRRIVAANNSLTREDPVWLVWACELAQRYNLSLSDEVQVMASSLAATEPVSVFPDAVAVAFTQILSRVGSIYPIMQTMADLGILSWIVPEFGRLMDLIPYDASHDYTVGQHTLLVVSFLERLSTGAAETSETEEQAEMRRALAELAHPEYLILAALLHDTGKAEPSFPHAEVSARIADTVCRRLNWPAEAVGHVRFLVLHHQLMGDTSRLRDLNMDRTIRDFVSIVDDPDRLNMLYLLTYADTRAVGEGIWTPVKGRFLRELWQRAAGAIYEQETPFSPGDMVADARRKFVRNLTLEKIESVDIEEHIEAMPPYYLLNSTQQDVALHISFVERVRKGEIVLDFHDERAANYTEITICTMDDPSPGLLSKIAAALLASSVNVHSAGVITRKSIRDTIAIDTLLVDYKGRPLSPGKCKEAAVLLHAALDGTRSIAELLPPKRRETQLSSQKARAGARVSHPARPLSIDLISHDFDHGISLLEVSGATALDLFYKICGAVSSLGWDIQAAKLSAARDLMRASLYVIGARQLSNSEIKRRVAYSLENTPTSRLC